MAIFNLVLGMPGSTHLLHLDWFQGTRNPFPPRFFGRVRLVCDIRLNRIHLITGDHYSQKEVVSSIA